METTVRKVKNNSSNKKWITIAGLLVGSAIIIYFFPLFHVVKIETAKQKKEEGKFNAKDYVDKFWTEQLSATLEKAVDAAALQTAVKTSPTDAKNQFSRRIGMGTTYYYFVKGEGKIVSVKPDAISISLDKSASKTDIILSTANIYGNTVRDGLGVFNVSDFQSSQKFNQISSELNKRIETAILPNLKQNAKIGAMINFAGCAEILDEKTDLQPLKIIPVKAEIQ